MRVASLPTGCDIEVAEHPERLPPYAWTDCFDGRAGCRQLAITWGVEGRRGTYQPYPEGSVERGQPVLVNLRWLDAELVRADIVDMPGGGIRGAFRYLAAPGTDACTIVGLSASDSSFVFTPTFHGTVLQSVLLSGVWRTPAAAGRFDLTTDLVGSDFASELSMGEGFVAIRLVPGQRIGVLRDGVYRQISPSAALPGIASRQYAVQDQVLYFRREAGQRVLAIAGPDAVARPYLGDATHAAFAIGTDGEWLAWAEGFGTTDGWVYDRQVVHIARFDPDPAALVSIRDVELGPGLIFQEMRLGGGWVAIPDSDALGVMHMLRFADGLLLDIEAPPGHVFLEEAAYVTAGEVGLHVAAEGTFVPRTVFRIALPAG